MERMHLDSSMHGDIGRPPTFVRPYHMSEAGLRRKLTLYHHYSSFGVHAERTKESELSRRSFLQGALSYDVLRPRCRLPLQKHMTEQREGGCLTMPK